MRSFAANHLVYSFSKEYAPIENILLGETVWIETADSYGNQLTEDYTGEQPMKLKGINPVTGPFFIDGVKKGDTLVVEILDIELPDQGIMYLRPGAGVYGDFLDHVEIRKIAVDKDKVLLPGNIEVEKRPMIGVIGNAPEGDPVITGSPGKHGGNMDTIFITKGATLYLPVYVDGALFALGDLHASMGDGETAICGVEIRGKVKLRFSRRADIQEAWPILEDDENWMVIASAGTLDEAAKEASVHMLKFIQKRSSLSVHDVARVLSIAGQLQISQVVNPLKTVRMVVPKRIFPTERLKF